MSELRTEARRHPGRRRFARKHVLLSARLYRGKRAIDCIVTDLSANGAQIAAWNLPAGTSLAALHIERFGMFPGEVRWLKNGTAGIRFLDQPDTVAAAVGGLLPQPQPALAATA